MHQHDWLTNLLRDMSGFVREAQLVNVEALAAKMRVRGSGDKPGAKTQLVAYQHGPMPTLRLVAACEARARSN